MMSLPPVLIMAGGTGGHVFPALAVADELRTRGVPVVWLGTQAGIEARLVPQAGYPIEWLSIQGLRGKNTLSLLLAPFRLVLACVQAMSVLRRRKPCAVLGMGGFASGPGGFMAWVSAQAVTDTRTECCCRHDQSHPGEINPQSARSISRCTGKKRGAHRQPGAQGHYRHRPARIAAADAP